MAKMDNRPAIPADCPGPPKTQWAVRYKSKMVSVVGDRIGEADVEAGLQTDPPSPSVDGDVANDGMKGESGKMECGHLPWPTADRCVWNEHWR